MSAPDLPPLLPAPAVALKRPLLVTFLSLVLGLFLVSAVISLASNSLLLFFGRQDLAVNDGLTILLLFFAGLVTCAVMAFVPAVPKRIFVPVSLFPLVGGIAVLPLFIYFSKSLFLIGVCFALVQLALGLFLLHRMHGGWKIRWPLFPERLLSARRFSFGNFAAVVLAGVLVLVPALTLYVAWSAQLAVDHFTAGFVALRSSGITMQVRHYVRDDGKKIMLVPMSHVGEEKFYHDLAASFPADSVVLMEGVTDHDKVAPVPVDYSLAAASIGGVEQKEAFRPPGKLVPADMDMSSFSPVTLDLLKTAFLLHSKGVTPETLPLLMKPMPPDLQQQLFDDILTKRNHHLLGVLQQRLPGTNQIIVPWGAAHMPEIAREILKLGFRQVSSQEFHAIRFGG